MSVRNDRIDIEKRDAREAAGAARTGATAARGNAHGHVRAEYAAPRLECLGAWSALTLQQSVPIFP